MNNIPVILCNRNRLQTTRNLLSQLHALGYTNLYVIDMVSTYEPLMQWYKEQTLAEVIYLQENIGHKVLWNSDILIRFRDYPFVTYSDSDIALNTSTPTGFIEKMILIAKDYRMDKVGLAIAIDDLPDNKVTRRMRSIEGPYWLSRIPHKDIVLYNAMVDTTFCVVRTDRPYTLRALRIGGYYTCYHMPWYNEWNSLSEEEQYVLDNNDSRYSSYKKLLNI